MTKILFKTFLLLSLSCLWLSEALSRGSYNEALNLALQINDVLLQNSSNLHDDSRSRGQTSLQHDQSILITDTQKEYARETVCLIEGYLNKNGGEAEESEDEDSIFSDVKQVLGGLKDGIDKVRVGSPGDVLSGVFDMVGCVAGLAKYAGPQGELVGNILANLCGLASSCLAGEEFKVEDSETAILEKTFRRELGSYRKDTLLAQSRGKIFDAELRLNVLSTLFADISRGESMNEATKAKALKNLGLISTNDFILSESSGFLEELWYFIEKAIKVDDEGNDPSEEDKDLAAHALLDYLILSHYRNKELTLLSGLYSAVDAGALGIAAVKALKSRVDRDEERMRRIFHHPDIAFYEFLQSEKHRTKREVINRLQPMSNFPGTKCAFHYEISNSQRPKTKDRYYVRWSSRSQRLKFKTLSSRKEPKDDDSVCFTLYKENRGIGKSHIGIFSRAAKGFVGRMKDGTIGRIHENCENDEKYGWSITTDEKGLSKLSWNKEYFTAISGDKSGVLAPENSGKPIQSFFQSKL